LSGRKTERAVIGALCSDGEKDFAAQARENLIKHHFDVTVGYRYQSSSRHFVGTVEQKQREILRNQVENNYHLFDVAINYQLTHRWSLTASLPILVATRHQGSGLFHTHGIGDAPLGPEPGFSADPRSTAAICFWRKPEDANRQEQFPGLRLHPRPADDYHQRSIHPGRRWRMGLCSGDAGLSTTFFNSMLYFSGAYLFNPKAPTGVPRSALQKAKDHVSLLINISIARASPMPCRKSRAGRKLWRTHGRRPRA